MELPDRIRYLSRLMFDAQRARSVYMESIGDDEASMSVAEELEPWLFGKKCIIPALQKCLATGNPTDSDVLNFSRIAKMSAMISTSGIVSKRKDPEYEEVYGKHIRA